MHPLSDEQRAMLDFEREHWRYGAKEAAVRARFGRSLVSYQQELSALLDVPAALDYAPSTVRRLRRLRQRRLAARRAVRAGA